VVIVGSNASSTSRNWGRWYAKAVAEQFGCRVGGDGGILVGGFDGRGDGNVKHTRMPVALLEPLFASNPQQADAIRSEAGQAEAERGAGYRSPFSAATAGWLRRVHIEHGTAYVDLHDLRAQLGGATSSCGAAELLTQIERTLRQFQTVRRVILAIDGEPRRFYEWLGQDCDLSNDRCDAAPFRTAAHP
jgi:hypothetical protein